MSKTFLLAITVFLPLQISLSLENLPTEEVSKVKELREYIKKEKVVYEQREKHKKDIGEDLDVLNNNQNKVREKIQSLNSNQKEMSMALDNLAIDVKKQRDLQASQHKRLFLLLKVVYKVKKEGMLHFVLNGENLTDVVRRVRIIYRTLRSHTEITKQLEDRARRLSEVEKKLEKSKDEFTYSLSELKDQEKLLAVYLKQKKRLIKQINEKQGSYLAAMREYKKMSAQVTAIFDQLPKKTTAPKKVEMVFNSLSVPVNGKLIKGFGKIIHEKFGTVINHKGVEIEAEHGSAVMAVGSGTVEYAGWVKGLGNVIIIHHGNHFYSLSAHLFKINKIATDAVTIGEVIGSVGDTGISDNPSLYFELREKGKAVDPALYFSRHALASLKQESIY